jgi:hypothetical protein
LIKSATEENVLKRFEQLGISREYAQDFDADIYIPNEPGSNSGLELPGNFERFLKGCSIVNLMYCSDEERCRIARDILQTVYQAIDRETDKVILLIVLEEAHTFLPGNVTGKAKEIAKEVRILINRIAREKAKYGCNFVMISQSLSDFKGEAKIVREMINSRFFLRASDKVELEYIENYVSKEAKEIVKNLKQGEVLVHGYALSASSGIKVYVRPPFSHVGELSDYDLRKAVYNPGEQAQHQSNDFSDECTEPSNRLHYADDLPEREQNALELIVEYYNSHHEPITSINLGNKMGLQGGSRQRIIDSLIRKGLVKTVRIANIGKGRPMQGIVPLV